MMTPFPPPLAPNCDGLEADPTVIAASHRFALRTISLRTNIYMWRTISLRTEAQLLFTRVYEILRMCMFFHHYKFMITCNINVSQGREPMMTYDVKTSAIHSFYSPVPKRVVVAHVRNR